jgi:hypothetical protein
MNNFFELGSCPVDEKCSQIGDRYYDLHAKRECTAFINQILRQCGTPPDNAEVKIKANFHEFGTYYMVAVFYCDENGLQYAKKVELEIGDAWDDLAKIELGVC